MLKLQKSGIYLKLKKCFFFQQRVDFLGHIISPGKLRIADKPCDPIRGQILSKKITDARAFLGLCNVYGRFVENFARIAHPLTERLKNSRRRRKKRFRH